MLEKAGSLGEHNLSGAVVNPRALRELFPDRAPSDFPFRQPVAGEAVYFMTEGRAQRLPTPPTMHNAGYYTASICEIVRWLGERAEELGVNLFAGFPVDALLVEGTAVRGVRTTPSGLTRDGGRTGDYTEPTDLTARITVLAEGTRGLLDPGLARVAAGGLPESAALRPGREGGLGERRGRSTGSSIPSAGRCPTTPSAGASCIRWAERQVAIGLVVGLDYHEAALDVHELLQRMKLHPLFRPYLEGGQLLEWGAKTIPEGGYYALPERRCGDGVLIAGDAAGFVDVPSLKGIHYAMQSGIYAARADLRGAQAGRHVAGGAGRHTIAWWTRATSSPTCTAPGTCGWRSRTGSTSAASRPD